MIIQDKFLSKAKYLNVDFEVKDQALDRNKDFRKVTIKSEERPNNKTYWVLETNSLTSPYIVGIRLENCSKCDQLENQAYCMPVKLLLSGRNLTCKPLGESTPNSGLLSCSKEKCKLNIVSGYSELEEGVFKYGKDAEFILEKN